ncbi:glycosyltransferase [Caldisericum exile]|uniref:Trehalose synthase n=1 Tax=Caldisericum exile (strain DSM 21853 / NBRC 104410 / AZM16c01) TaxID=511051 RepID=A0A7U6JFZ3_CALEA|nr:glycosyltransferase [Caldisericum exile]BAL80795.1 trehalose synthase [Caldisericum exile AZM16c01]
MAKIDDYRSVVSNEVVDELYSISKHLQGKVIQNINSTAVGGGVAEILTRMVPLLKELGINALWDVIKGNDRFFTITKKMHNALHGVDIEITKEEFEYFLEVDRENFSILDGNAHIIFVHDPQPVALVEKRKEFKSKWLWRCHIDFSNPKENVWQFLKNYIENYDLAVFSAPAFARSLSIPQVLISPSIDPLSDKNRELTGNEINEVFERFKIDRSRPIITQISRFDYLKDPVGVIEAYKLVKKHVDCQLILAGGGANDDPEGEKVLNEVMDRASSDPDIHVLLLPPGSDIEINALQRGSTVVLQKSLREGFGLTVAEALWKAKPVIASAVGGIPLQITHKYSGILTLTVEGTAYWIKQLIQAPEFAYNLGRNGREHIRNNFLITRHLRDYMLTFLSLITKGEVVRL